MLTVDGSRGEGGGQILRTALALSLVTGTPFRIDNIRAGRQRPGLLRQHLTAVEAARAVSMAGVIGATVGSKELTFSPGRCRGGTYSFSIGTAGSTTLVLQTILPGLLTASEPSVVSIEGGTHNPHSPPYEFLERAYLPLVAKLGARVVSELERPGYYPAGGGKLRVNIEPAKALTRIDIIERGAVLTQKATATVANLPRDIAQREISTLRQELGWDGSLCEVITRRDSPGPGNVVSVEIESEHIREVFTSFGERGIRAEAVAQRVAAEVRDYLAHDVPVGRHLADQLVLLLAMSGGGSFRTLAPTSHTTTQLELVPQFLEVACRCAEQSSGVFRIDISARSARA
jgi:RNA 3'-terminal phosphate cyclase (ATP)